MVVGGKVYCLVVTNDGIIESLQLDLRKGPIVVEEIILRTHFEGHIVYLNGLLKILQRQTHVPIVAQEHLIQGLKLNSLAIIGLGLENILEAKMAVPSVIKVTSPAVGSYRLIVFNYCLLVVSQSLKGISQDEI